MAIIEDYKFIANRQREIAIREGIAPCANCRATGWREYCDEEGGLFFAECPHCRNPFGRHPPD